MYIFVREVGCKKKARKPIGNNKVEQIFFLLSNYKPFPRFKKPLQQRQWNKSTYGWKRLYWIIKSVFN